MVWDRSFASFSTFHSKVGIILDGKVKGLSRPITLANYYGPYFDRRIFWDIFQNSGLLSSNKLILAGDLNLTLSTNEIWGSKAKHDPLATHFSSLFQDSGLINVFPASMAPTWRNGRVNNKGIVKRLYHFLLVENLIPCFSRYISCVGFENISNNFSVFLEIEFQRYFTPSLLQPNMAWRLVSWQVGKGSLAFNGGATIWFRHGLVLL